MATVYVTLGQSGANSPSGGVPVYRGPGRSETITSSGTAASGSLEANPNDIATIWCDTALYVNVGGTASATVGRYVPASTMVDIAIAAGQTVSVIDA